MADCDSGALAPSVTRVCTDCRIEKPATREHFHAYKRAPDTCRAVCKTCRARDHAEHREERLPQRREHYKKNAARLNAVSRANYRADIDRQRAAAAVRYWQNREARVQQKREYLAVNREAINERRRPRSVAAFQERYGSDLEFTLKHRLRALMRVTLTKGREGHRMREVLGYGAEELKAHLERLFAPRMTWAKFMCGEIHIDHVLPVKSFNIKSAGDAEFRACWSLANLRPMWKRDNLAKGGKVLTLL